jgi:hypothetical protein
VGVGGGGGQHAQLVKITTLAITELKSSLWAHLEVNGMLQFLMMCHMLQFNMGQLKGHQTWPSALNYPKDASSKVFRKSITL